VKILVIDDNEFIRGVAAKALRSRGHEVILAVDGIEGLRLAQEENPDRIICDHEMPGLNGSQVFARLSVELQDRLYLWSGDAPDTFPRPERVIAKPCSVGELIARTHISSAKVAAK
jgi:CheY-like chemotaxis protein